MIDGGYCEECGTPLVLSPRCNWYCPDCDVCVECGVERADGDYHEGWCSILRDHERQLIRDRLWRLQREISFCVRSPEGYPGALALKLRDLRSEYRECWRELYPQYYVPLTSRRVANVVLRYRPDRLYSPRGRYTARPLQQEGTR